MSRSLVILLALAVAALSTPHQNKTLSIGYCFLDLAINYPNAPLLVNANLSFPDPIVSGYTLLAFPEAEIFYIGCPGGEFNYAMISDGEPAFCTADNLIVTMNSGLYADFDDLTCELYPQERPHMFQQHPSALCENTGKIVNLGYSIDNNYVSVISTCFDPITLVTLYSKYIPSPWSNKLSGYIPLTYDVAVLDLFNNINLFSIYENLQEIVESLGVHGYITNDVYLEEIYLATVDDFLTVFEKDTTVDLVNTATRWNTFSAGNWKSLEDSVRILVEDRIVKNAVVLSGTLGVATLPDDNGNPVDLYLANGTIPVARWFWKIVYSPNNQFYALVFGFNNPYVAKPVVDKEFSSTICTENIIDEHLWILGLDNVNPLSGFMYACDFWSPAIINPVISDIVNNLFANTADMIPGGDTPIVFHKEQHIQNNKNNNNYIIKVPKPVSNKP